MKTQEDLELIMIQLRRLAQDAETLNDISLANAIWLAEAVARKRLSIDFGEELEMQQWLQ